MLFFHIVTNVFLGLRPPAVTLLLFILKRAAAGQTLHLRSAVQRVSERVLLHILDRKQFQDSSTVQEYMSRCYKCFAVSKSDLSLWQAMRQDVSTLCQGKMCVLKNEWTSVQRQRGNCDYAAEHGATRLFEAAKLLQEQEKAIEKQEQEDSTNPMKMLEKRTKMSRNEMEALGKLEELQELNRRQAKVDYANMLEKYQKEETEKLQKQEEEDEAFVKSLFGAGSSKKIKEEPEESASAPGPSTSGKVKRILEDSDEDDADTLPDFTKDKAKEELEDFSKESFFFARSKQHVEKKQKLGLAVSAQKKLLSGLVVVKKKTENAKNQEHIGKPETEEKLNSEEQGTKETSVEPSGSLNLLGGYGNSSSSDSD